MKVRASSLDDLLHEVFRRLHSSGRVVEPRKGKNYEITGAVLELTNPRARMSRTETRAVIFGWLGELLWYLARSDELASVKYYLKEYPADCKGVTRVRAAYGPGLQSKNKNQLTWVIELLKTNPGSRRAVIPIYHPKDTYASLSEVPCTCTLQFLLRGPRLEMITHMRSNDAFIGLLADIFAFTMIQELIARALGVGPGVYKHLVGSLHLYERNQRGAQQFLAEGWQRKIAMPMMPLEDSFVHLKRLLRFERSVRIGGRPKLPTDLPEYWQDIARLLLIFRAGKDKKPPPYLRRIRNSMQSDSYAPYIGARLKQAEKREAAASGQPTLFE